MEIVSSQQILKNIYNIGSCQQVMVKDIERAAGVSTGYLSKLFKMDGEVKLSVDMLLRIGALFGMSVDAIVNYHKRSNVFLADDAKKLIGWLTEDTQNDALTWQFCEHLDRSEELPRKLGFTDIRSEPTGAYMAALNSKSTVLLCQARYFRQTGQRPDADWVGFELYMADEGHTYPVLMAVEGEGDAMYEGLAKLHRSVIRNMDDIKVNEKVKDMIFNYVLGRGGGGRDMTGGVTKMKEKPASAEGK